MKLKNVVICVSFSLLFAADAAAQWSQEVTSWYVETRYGRVGYSETDFGGGAKGILSRYLELGPFGQILLTTRVYIAGIVVVAIMFVAIAGLSIGLRRRRANAQSAPENTIDAMGAAAGKSVE